MSVLRLIAKVRHTAAFVAPPSSAATTAVIFSVSITTTPQGEFLFHVFGALAQFERSLVQERVRAGLAAARRRGRRGGRPVVIPSARSVTGTRCRAPSARLPSRADGTATARDGRASTPFYANCLAAGCGSGVVAVLPLPCPSNEISIGEPQRAGAEGAPVFCRDFTAARAP